MYHDIVDEMPLRHVVLHTTELKFLIAAPSTQDLVGAEVNWFQL